MDDVKELYYVGFSKGSNHFSYKAMLTIAEYVRASAFLAEHSDSYEVVKDAFYHWAENYAGLEEAMDSILV